MAIKIVKVVLKGFKSHVNSVFNYSPGLSVVTGPTDSGKSAGVMQPIKWVTFGEPSGEAFIFTLRDPKTKEVVRQAEAVEVEIHLEDGMTVSKTRRKGKTAYFINGNLISEKAEVPQEVKDVLGLSKIEYGDFETSLNFAYQLEAPFILSETASVGAKVLGKLAGTEIVDKSIAAIMKRTYKARDEKSTAQKIIDLANVELLEYLQVDDLKEKVEACEGLLEQLDRDTVRMDRVEKLAASYGVLSDKIDSCNTLLDRLAVVHDIADDLSVIELAQAKYDELIQLYGRLNNLEAGLKTIKDRLEALKDVNTASILLGNIEGTYGTLEGLEALFTNFGHISNSISNLEGTLGQYKNLPAAADLLQVTEQGYGTLGRLQGLTATYREVITGISDNEAIVTKCRILGECSTLLNNLELSAARAQLIGTQVTYLKTIDARIKQLEDQVKSFSSIPTSYAALEEAITSFERLSKLKQLKTEYDTKQQAAISADLTHSQKCIALQDAEKELTEAWEAAGELCPVCEQPVNKHSQVERCKV